MKTLYEFSAPGGEGEDSYIRAYVWAESEERAKELFELKNKGVYQVQVTLIESLFREDSPEFCSQINDHGFVIE